MLVYLVVGDFDFVEEFPHCACGKRRKIGLLFHEIYTESGFNISKSLILRESGLCTLFWYGFQNPLMAESNGIFMQ